MKAPEVKEDRAGYGRKRVSPWYSTTRWRPEAMSLCFPHLEWQYENDPVIYAGGYRPDINRYETVGEYQQSWEVDGRRSPKVIRFRYTPEFHYLTMRRKETS